MKRKFLRFENIDVVLPPDHRKKFMRVAHYNGGGGAPAPTAGMDDEAIIDTDTDETKLLKGIRNQTREIIRKRNYQNADQIPQLLGTALGGFTPEQLREFKGNVEKNETTVKNIAAALEKIQQRVDAAGNPGAAPVQHLRAVIEKHMYKIKSIFDARQNNNDIVFNTRAAVVMSTSNTLPTEEIPEDILHSFSVDTFKKKRRPKEYIYDIASRRTVAQVTEYKTWLEEGTEDGAFALVVEGAVKPLVSKTLIRNVSKYRKVAGKRVYTEEFAMFRKEIYSILEDLFNDQLMRNYAAILMVDLLAAAAGYVGTSLDGQYTAPTDYHAIGAVAAQIETLEFEPDLLVLHPQDKWRIGLQQASDGHFFVNIPQLNPQTGTVQMLGFRVVTSTRMDVGEFMLGESGLYKIEDMPVSVRLGYGIEVVKDMDGKVTDVTSDVDTNRFRIIAETFFHDYIGTNDAGSFVKASFADVKAALLAP